MEPELHKSNDSSDNQDMNYAREVAIGAVCGLRSFTGPAVIAGAANRNILKLQRTPLAWLGSGRSAHTAALLAAGELIADKLPFMPNRTDAPSLIARFVSGAICGMAVAGRSRRNARIMSGIVGGTAAIAAAYAGYQYRKHVKLPAPVAAVLEDVVAVSAGTAVVSRLCA
jgi:uncharacterized membrane protein